MNSVHLDCSALPRSISLNGEGIPRSIYVDGQDFVNKLQQVFMEAAGALEFNRPEPPVKKEITVQEAVEVLTKAIDTDPALYTGYQANIAMAFMDAYDKVEKSMASSFSRSIYIPTPEGGRIRTDALSMIANEAAKSFLKQWCADANK